MVYVICCCYVYLFVYVICCAYCITAATGLTTHVQSIKIIIKGNAVSEIEIMITFRSISLVIFPISSESSPTLTSCKVDRVASEYNHITSSQCYLFPTQCTGRCGVQGQTGLSGLSQATHIIASPVVMQRVNTSAETNGQGRTKSSWNQRSHSCLGDIWRSAVVTLPLRSWAQTDGHDQTLNWGGISRLPRNNSTHVTSNLFTSYKYLPTLKGWQEI
jgi:hypothetical protein